MEIPVEKLIANAGVQICTNSSPVAEAGKPVPPDPSRRIPFSGMIAGGRLNVTDVLQPIYDEINEQYGLNEQPKYLGGIDARSRRGKPDIQSLD